MMSSEMPTYAYACADCGHAFDAVQSFTDESLTVCPECGGRLRKQFGAVGVVFKGGGFYKTDSRASGANGSSGSTSSGSSSTKDSGSSTGSESSTGSSAPSASSTAG